MRFDIVQEEADKGGIYILKSEVSDDCYVGATKNFWSRYNSHKNNFKSKNTYQPLLFSFISKHGDCLVMSCHTLCDTKSGRLNLEKKVIAELNPSLNYFKPKVDLRDHRMLGEGGKKLETAINDAERIVIEECLKANFYHMGRTAKALGLSRPTLAARIKHLEIPTANEQKQ